MLVAMKDGQPDMVPVSPDISNMIPFEGLEALTPLPQGDVNIEEIKENIGEKVLLDGIPAILFLPHYPMKELEECVEKLIELFVWLERSRIMTQKWVELGNVSEKSRR